jgi:hypothetical protein
VTADTCWKSFKAESEHAVAQFKNLLHEGNVRRVLIEHSGKTVAEFPLTVGVVGLIAAPVLAAVAAFVALLKDCTIRVEVSAAEQPEAPPAGGTEHAPVDAQC